MLLSGGGAGGFSGEVKAGFSKGAQEAISKASEAKTRTMNVSYNVCISHISSKTTPPRVLVDGC
jgi:hypothetical protein